MTAASRADRSRGSATIWLLVGCGLLLAGTVVALTLGAAVIARHRAESAADLAALSAATTLMQGGSHPCAASGAVAAASGARQVACTVAGASVVVVTEVRVDWPFPGATLDMPPARAQARAGAEDVPRAQLRSG